jgi:hypothetical protein
MRMKKRLQVLLMPSLAAISFLSITFAAMPAAAQSAQHSGAIAATTDDSGCE